MLWPIGWMDQDATWYGGRPRPRRLCVRWEPRSSLLQRGRLRSPQFSAHVYCGQTAGWIKMALGMEVGLDLRDIVLDGDRVPLTKRGQSPTPNFRRMSIVAKRLGGSRCHLVRRWASAQTTLCYMGTQLPPPKKKGHSPQFSAHVYCGQTAVCSA